MTGFRNMGLKWKIAMGFVLFLIVIIALYVAFGSAGMNSAYQPQNEFQLEPWVSIKLGKVDLSINKAFLYIWMASALTAGTMVFVARRMRQRPNRVQTAVETTYTFMRDNITRGNMDAATARKWFPFIATLFLWILFANLEGYIPLPVNTGEPWHIGSVDIPSFQIYAATANLSVPLILTLIVWFLYHIEGVRAKGFRGYLKSWLPAGTPSGPFGLGTALIFAIEAISHFVRIISLSVRLYANILAGHMLILFMAGGLVVLLGLAALAVVTVPVAVAFYIFESLLIATLQAFIFATLAAIYIGSAVATEH